MIIGKIHHLQPWLLAALREAIMVMTPATSARRRRWVNTISTTGDNLFYLISEDTTEPLRRAEYRHLLSRYPDCAPRQRGDDLQHLAGRRAADRLAGGERHRLLLQGTQEQTVILTKGTLCFIPESA